MQKVTYETEEGDIPFAVAYETTEELDKAQKDQDSLQDELEATVGHSTMSCVPISAKRQSNSACQKTGQLKRKASDAHDRTQSYRERCRRAPKEHVKSECAGSAEVRVLLRDDCNGQGGRNEEKWVGSKFAASTIMECVSWV